MATHEKNVLMDIRDLTKVAIVYGINNAKTKEEEFYD